jgi:hypothetical protein
MRVALVVDGEGELVVPLIFYVDDFHRAQMTDPM